MTPIDTEAGTDGASRRDAAASANPDPGDEEATAPPVDALTMALARSTALKAALQLTEQSRHELADRLEATMVEAARQRRRIERERDDAVKYANEQLVGALAPLLDDLERARGAAAALGAAVQPYVDGVRMMERQMLAVLQRFGVIVFSTLGEPFDPTRAEAFGLRATDGVQDGIVVEEVRRGIVLHGRLVRPALVVVSTKSDAR